MRSRFGSEFGFGVVVLSFLAVSSAGAGVEGELSSPLRDAMLRTYVHGVDDALAEDVVAPSDLAELRGLLSDARFPRRDNVVAFLAHRDGGEAVPALLALLQAPRHRRASPRKTAPSSWSRSPWAISPAGEAATRSGPCSR